MTSFEVKTSKNRVPPKQFKVLGLLFLIGLLFVIYFFSFMDWVDTPGHWANRKQELPYWALFTGIVVMAVAYSINSFLGHRYDAATVRLDAEKLTLVYRSHQLEIQRANIIETKEPDYYTQHQELKLIFDNDWLYLRFGNKGDLLDFEDILWNNGQLTS